MQRVVEIGYMGYIVVDTEYTTWPGALERGWTGPNEHREIVQISAIHVGDAGQELAYFDRLVRPKVNPMLSDVFVALTHITQASVDTEGQSFPLVQSEFLEFCQQGVLPIVCMNADEAVFLENNCLHQTVFPFPISWHRLRPHLESVGVDLTARSSGDLHSLTDMPLYGHTHNALHDVRSMQRWMSRQQTPPGGFDVCGLPTGAPNTDPRSQLARRSE